MSLAILPAEEEFQIQEASSARRLIEWTLEQSARKKLIITTGFGMEGCALIEMYASYLKPLEVVYLDTGFFFPETYHLIDRMKARYPHLVFVDRGTPLTPEQQAARYGDELWRNDPDLCCRLRKVDPMREVLRDADMWVTGIRRGQSVSRARARPVSWNDKYGVLKVSPLADWSRQQVWDYVQLAGVPYNRLHEQGYPSIGCTHCTQAVAGLTQDRYSRAGRWAGNEKTECGLHV